MKKVYRAHPLMITGLIKPLLFVLFLPAINAVIDYFRKGKIDSFLGAEILAVCLIIAFSALRCAAFKLTLDGDKILIRTGFLFVKRAEIKAGKLSSVQTERNIIDLIFRSVTFHINTEAGSHRKSDFYFKLHLADAREISQQLYSGKPKLLQSFSAVKVAVMAAATSSAFTGMIVGVPLINRAGKLLGIGLSDMLFAEINNVSSKFNNYFPPIVNTVSVILLLAYLISFLYSFFKFVNFRLALSEDNLEVRTGLFVRKYTSFKKRAVNNVLIVQTPLMLAFRRFSMKVSVGGFGEPKSESQVIVPSGKREEIKQNFSTYFPFLAPVGNKIRAERKRNIRDRFLLWPAVYLILVIIASVISALIFTEFGRLIFFLSIVLACIVFYYAYICMFEYTRGAVILGENVFAKSNRFFRTCELYCPKERIGQIKITRFPLDILQNTCRIRFTVCSESADSVRVRHLNYGKIQAELYDFLKSDE